MAPNANGNLQEIDIKCGIEDVLKLLDKVKEVGTVFISLSSSFQRRDLALEIIPRGWQIDVSETLRFLFADTLPENRADEIKGLVHLLDREDALNWPAFINNQQNEPNLFLVDIYLFQASGIRNKALSFLSTAIINRGFEHPFEPAYWKRELEIPDDIISTLTIAVSENGAINTIADAIILILNDNSIFENPETCIKINRIIRLTFFCRSISDDRRNRISDILYKLAHKIFSSDNPGSIEERNGFQSLTKGCQLVQFESIKERITSDEVIRMWRLVGKGQWEESISIAEWIADFNNDPKYKWDFEGLRLQICLRRSPIDHNAKREIILRLKKMKTTSEDGLLKSSFRRIINACLKDNYCENCGIAKYISSRKCPGCGHIYDSAP